MGKEKRSSSGTLLRNVTASEFAFRDPGSIPRKKGYTCHDVIMLVMGESKEGK
jgi:hypothetical protein